MDFITKNKQKIPIIIGLSLSLILLGYFLYPALSSFTGPLTDLPIYVGAPQPYSYIMDENSTHYFAWNGTTGQNVYTSTNATEVFEDCWNTLYAGMGGSIFLRVGVYNITDDVIVLKDGTGTPSISIIGEVRPSDKSVIIWGNGPYMVTSNCTAWETGANGAFHSLKNLHFEHYTPNDDAITLRLQAMLPEMENLWIRNNNATRQGTGIKVWTTTAQGNSGYPHTWRNVEVVSYGTGFYIDADHITIIQPIIYDAKDYAFIMADCSFNTVVQLQILTATSPTDAHMLWFNDTQQAIQLFGVCVEGGATTFNEPIITADNTPGTVQIYGFYMEGTMNTGVPFWNRTDTGGTAEFFIYLDSSEGHFKSQRASKTTVANGEWIPHLLFNEPYCVQLTIEDDLIYDSVPVLVGVNDKNATKFQVSIYWANGTAITDDTIEVYWYASVNRVGA